MKTRDAAINARFIAGIKRPLVLTREAWHCYATKYIFDDEPYINANLDAMVSAGVLAAIGLILARHVTSVSG